jgi:hypothetical protein
VVPYTPVLVAFELLLMAIHLWIMAYKL